jgi:hypothetical protein
MVVLSPPGFLGIPSALGASPGPEEFASEPGPESIRGSISTAFKPDSIRGASRLD